MSEHLSLRHPEFVRDDELRREPGLSAFVSCDDLVEPAVNHSGLSRIVDDNECVVLVRILLRREQIVDKEMLEFATLELGAIARLFDSSVATDFDGFHGYFLRMYCF